MKKIILFFILLILFACNENDDADIKTFSLFSKAFKNNGKIPLKYMDKSVSGKNLSIPLNWKKPPPNTKTFAILMTDRHPVANNFIHWFVINIPKSTQEIKEKSSIVKMPENAVEFNNSFGYKGYGGPAAPEGTGSHEYLITIYALNSDFMDEFAGKEADYMDYETVKSVLDKYMLGKAELTGICER
jgi:Raf kinase inhibitor-like YbhB/YbcL family protein